MKRVGTKVLSVILVFAFVLGFVPTTEASAKKKATIKSVKITNASAISKKEFVGGQKITMKVKVTVSGKISKAVSYKSSNKKVATVSAKGVITAKTVAKASKATITVTSKKNKKKKASVKVTVYPKKAADTNVDTLTDDNIKEEVNPIDTISFVSQSLTISCTEDDLNDSEDPYTFILGDEDSTDDNENAYALTVKTITGESFDLSKLNWGYNTGATKDIVYLANNGTFTIKKFGTTVIVASYGSKYATLTINIVKEVEDSSDDGDDDGYDDGEDDGSDDGTDDGVDDEDTDDDSEEY